MSTPSIHVERATLEDLNAVWDIAVMVNETEAVKAGLANAVQERHCLVARRGWQVIGYAIRKPDFFGYPFIQTIATHPDQRRQGIARKLFAYAEKTVQQDRIFTSITESNTIAHHMLLTLGYVPCGSLYHLQANNEHTRFYVKMLAE